MDDLISRQAAIEAIEDLDWYHQNKNKDMVLGANSDEHQAWYKADGIYKTLDVLPSAQTERKKGRWLNHLGLPLNDFCSVCAKDSPYNKHWDFCPNCGADMREGKEL